MTQRPPKPPLKIRLERPAGGREHWACSAAQVLVTSRKELVHDTGKEKRQPPPPKKKKKKRFVSAMKDLKGKRERK